MVKHQLLGKIESESRMVGTSKILTVSYGTFSCTLEGFDDSFGTMKAIAEYFRDLASDDRYFGAEPPTPDTEMLQRIAEREIRKQVEARREGDGVVLRARTDDKALARPQPDTPAPQQEPPRESQAQADAAAASSEPAPATQAEPGTSDLGSVAARLARIRAVVDNARNTPPTAQAPAPAAPASPDEDETFEDEIDAGPTSPQAGDAASDPTTVASHDGSETQDKAPRDVSPEPVAPAPAQSETVIDQGDAERSPTAEMASEPETPVPDDADEIFPEDGDETGQLPDAVLSAVDTPDDDDAGDTASDDEAAILSAVSSGLAAQAATAEPDVAPAAGPDVEVDADSSTPSIGAAHDDSPAPPAETGDTGDTAPAPQADATAEEPQQDEDISARAEEPQAEKGLQDFAAQAAPEPKVAEDPEATLEAEATTEADEAPEAETTAEADETPEAETTPEADEAPEDRRARRQSRRAEKARRADPGEPDHTSAVAARARARVMKMKRSELAPAEEDPQAQSPAAEQATKDARPSAPEAAPLTLENPVRPQKPERTERRRASDTPSPDAATPDDAAAEEKTDLTPEQEADLMAELAELESETAAGRTRPEMQKPAGDDAAVSRLIDQVNTRMDGPEQKRRRSAIAHLKAAVAATVADRGLLPRKNQEAEVEAQKAPYRRDLREVVRPTHPSRGASGQMPPLMLVSEQRIDRARSGDARPAAQGNLALQRDEDEAEAEAEENPVSRNIFSDDDSFADFAERMGAHDLPDLLEAAAAYCLSVEKHQTFTRPQVMQLAAEQYAADEFPREDGLRAFGALLREGPFERVRRGEFTIAGASRFMTSQTR